MVHAYFLIHSSIRLLGDWEIPNRGGGGGGLHITLLHQRLLRIFLNAKGRGCASSSSCHQWLITASPLLSLLLRQHCRVSEETQHEAWTGILEKAAACRKRNCGRSRQAATHNR